MRKIYYILALLPLLASCNDWLQDAETSPNTINEDLLTNPKMFGDVTDGEFSAGTNLLSITNKAIDLTSDLYMYAGSISDEFGAPDNPNALTYRDLSSDDLNIHDGSLRDIWTKSYSLYSMASDIEGYVNNTTWSDSSEDATIKDESYWYCHYFKGLALYNIASYFNGNRDTSGEPFVYIDGSQVANSEVLNLANEELKLSLEFGTSYEQRISSTILVRSLVMSGDYSGAKEYVDNMLTDSDMAQMVSHELSDNTLFTAVGVGSRDAKVNSSFVDVLTIPAASIYNSVAIDDQTGELIQTRYGQYDSQTITSHIEAELLRAELILNSVISGDFAESLNSVANYYDPSGESEREDIETTLEELQHYRRVFLSWNGQRMLDQRRWSIDGDDVIPFTTRTFKYIAIDDIEE